MAEALREAFGRDRLRSSCSARSCAATAPGSRRLVELARQLGLPVVATNDVHVHDRRRGRAAGRPGGDPRRHATLDACEAERRGNREHVLKSPEEMAALFADLPEAVAEHGRDGRALRSST